MDGQCSFHLFSNFSEILSKLLSSVDQQRYHQLTVDHISASFSQAAELNDIGVLETIILAIGSVGSVATGLYDIIFHSGFIYLFKTTAHLFLLYYHCKVDAKRITIF